MVQRGPAGDAREAATQGTTPAVPAHVNRAALGPEFGIPHGIQECHHLGMQARTVLVPPCLERMRLHRVATATDHLVPLHHHAAHLVVLSHAAPAFDLGLAEEPMVPVTKPASRAACQKGVEPGENLGPGRHRIIGMEMLHVRCIARKPQTVNAVVNGSRAWSRTTERLGYEPDGANRASLLKWFSRDDSNAPFNRPSQGQAQIHWREINWLSALSHARAMLDAMLDRPTALN